MGYNWTKRLKVVFLAKQLPVFRLKIGRRGGGYSPPLCGKSLQGSILNHSLRFYLVWRWCPGVTSISKLTHLSFHTERSNFQLFMVVMRRLNALQSVRTRLNVLRKRVFVENSGRCVGKRQGASSSHSIGTRSTDRWVKCNPPPCALLSSNPAYWDPPTTHSLSLWEKQNTCSQL